MRKLLLILVLFLGALTMNAQTAYEKSKFFDNTYIGVSGEVTTPLTFNQFAPLNSGLSLKIGKWVTPALGFNIEGSMGFGSAIDQSLRYSYKTAVRESNVGVNVTVDMFNLFKYKERRVFTIIPEVGLGWLHGYNSNCDDTDDLSAKTGIQFAFNVGKYRAWQLYVEPEVLWQLTNGRDVQFDKRRAQLGLQIGFNYRFKNSYGGHNFKVYDIGEYQRTIDRLNEELAKKPTEVQVLSTVEVPVEVIRPYDSRIVVFFAQNSDTIVDVALLDEIPEGTVVNVYGYASPEGTEEYNKDLSQRRAEAVASYLTDLGVQVNLTQGEGVMGETSNRVVVVFTDVNVDEAPVEETETTETTEDTEEGTEVLDEETETAEETPTEETEELELVED